VAFTAPFTIEVPAGVRRFFGRHPRLTRFLEIAVLPVEATTKKMVFGCKMCGQCILHETGMTCPMGCPG